MASNAAKAVQGFLSRRITSTAIVTVLLATAFFALAASPSPQEPMSSPAPTATILSPFAVLEPSTKNNPNDKDGFPPTKSEADPEEAFLLASVVTSVDIYDATATLAYFPYDGVSDLTIDDDTPRSLDALDGAVDGVLAAGTYYVYWNLNKTGYVPVNTTPGSPYNGSNSASISIVDDADQFRLDLAYRAAPSDPPETISSELYTVTMWKSASINQNDLNWIDTEPKVIIANATDVFTVRSKYRQSSAQGLEWMILQSYFNGLNLRMRSVTLYYYDNADPGSIVDDVPAGWTRSWTDQQQFTGSDLGDTDNKDYWVTEYTYEARTNKGSEIIPYIQTKKGGDSWKIDNGYAGFQGWVPGGVNPAVLVISKQFSEGYTGGVVSGPDPPVVGMTTVYEIDITVGNTGEDDAIDVVVTDTAQLANVVWLDTYTVSQGTLSFDAGTGVITWSVGTLHKDDTATLLYQVALTPTPAMTGERVLLNAGAYATGTSKTSGATIDAGPTDPLYTEPVIGLPDMRITKSANQDTADPGDLITYTLHYKNTGASTAYNVAVQDTIPEHVSYQNSSPTYGSVSGRTFTWYLGAVAAGASGDITIIVKVDAGTPDGTLLANLGRVEYTDGGGEPQPPVDDWKNITVTAPVVTFDKSADLAYADPGDIITYTLTAHNSGNGSASGVVIKDTIPEHTTYYSAIPAYSSVSGRTYTWDLGTLAPGETKTVTLKVKVDAGTPDLTVLTNTATLDYSDANGEPYPQEDDSTTTTVTAPVMTFTKGTDVAYADPGDLITYTISYANGGSGMATCVVVTDTIPSHTSFVSSSPSYSSVTGSTYTWEIGDVAAYASGTVTVIVKVIAGTPDQTVLTNAATFDYADANGNAYPQLSDDATTTVTAPVMTFTKSVDVSQADPGDIITYTLYYHNTGTGLATGVTVKDTIPLHVTYVSSTPAYTSVSGRTYTWSVGTVGAGADGTIILKVKVDASVLDGTVLTNTATFDYADANGNAYPQLSDDATTTVTAPVMTFTKVADIDAANPGDVVTYTLSYKNLGSGMATLAVIEDTLPSSMTFVDATPYPDSVSGNVLTWNIGDVSPGTDAAITIEAQVNAGTPDGTVLHNAATFDYADANGNAYPQLASSYDVTTIAPVISFVKSADVFTADPGDEITYTLDYANTGGGIATGVVIVDTLPLHVTLVSAVPYPDSVVGRVLTWDVGTVAAHTSGDITITVEVDAYTSDGTFLVNSATFNYDDANGNPYPQKSDEAEVTVTAPVLHVNKIADVQKADPSDFITYTITFSNTGSGTATGVIIKDTIPEHVAFISSTPAYDQVSGRTYEWDVGTVVCGGSGTITIVVQVDVGTPDATLLHNVATLTYDDANGNPYPQLSDDADVTVTAPVVDLTKTAGEEYADPGDYIAYTVTFVNSGGGNATDVYVRDTVPEHVAFITSDPGYSDVSGRTYTWHWDLILPGESATIDIVVKVDAYTADQTLLHNVATSEYDDDSGNPYPTLTAYADVTVTAPVFTFDKGADVSHADPGDLITYALAWENAGSGWASAVVITDTIPDHVDFVSSVPDHSGVSGNTYTYDLGDIEPGVSGQIVIVVKVQAYTADETVLHNAATLDYSDANGNPYPQTDDYADVAVTAPVVSFTKTGDLSTADPGDYVSYKLCFENSGTGVATGVVVTDTLPDHVTFFDSDPLPDSQVGQTLVWTIGMVGGGGGGCIVIGVQVDVGTSDRTLLHNVAALDYADANDNPYPQIERYWDIRVTAPVMTFSKAADVSLADPGDFIVYTLAYENSGTGDASGVVVVDTLPEDVTLVFASIPPTSVVGNVVTWYIGDVDALSSGSIVVIVRVNPGTPDKTLLHNAATLDYSDANGNFIEQLTGEADVTVTAPVMTLAKEAGDVTVSAYVIADFRLRIAGEKWHDVVLTIYDDNVPKVLASVTRYPGSPDDQSVTVYGVKIDLLNSYRALIEYTPLDDPINGQWLGDDPCWLYLTFQDGHTVRLFHNFNVKHNDTWKWTIDDFRPYLKGQPITYEATIPYTITYENTGTGDASNVFVNDTFPTGFALLDSSPLYDSCYSDVCTWYIGDVAAGGMGRIFVNITYIFDVNGTVVTNRVTLDYSDANGNFIERLSASADSVLILPSIVERSAGGTLGLGPLATVVSDALTPVRAPADEPSSESVQAGGSPSETARSVEDGLSVRRALEDPARSAVTAITPARAIEVARPWEAPADARVPTPINADAPSVAGGHRPAGGAVASEPVGPASVPPSMVPLQPRSLATAGDLFTGRRR